MKVFTKAILKKIGLTETEYFMLMSEIEAINKDCKSDEFAVYFLDCYYFNNEDVKHAIQKIVIYFAKQYQGDYTQCSLRGACSYIATRLNCNSRGVMRLLKGMSYNNSTIYIADTFGLDVLGIQ